MKLESANKVIKPGVLSACHGVNPTGERIGFTNFYMTKNNQPVIPVVGEIHFSRFSYLYWEEELLKMKAGGVNIVATYVFWNHHEEEEGEFQWGENRNLRHFIDLCSKHKMPLILRIGPFCHGEVRNGGIPDWIFNKPLEVRSNDPLYLDYANKLYREIARQITGSFYQEGGPVIGIQLENEFMHAGAPLDAWGYKPGVYVSSGVGGQEHLLELRKLAEAAGMRPLFFTATAWGGAAVLETDTLPMLAGYAYTPWIPNQPPSGEYIFRDLHTTPAEDVNYEPLAYPVAYCEMAGGMQVSYNARPFVAPASIEAMTIVKLASGSNLLGYYMYHGGTNPIGKNGFLNESGLPKLTYDYQSPLGEFGRVSPAYDRIRTMALFLESFGSVLAPMGTYLPDGQDSLDPKDTEQLRWCVRQQDGSGFLFINNFQDHVEMPDREAVRVELETDQGAVSFPQNGSFTLKKDASVIFPFHLEIDKVHYTSGTVQPLTRLQKRQQCVHVFYAHEGILPELVLDKQSVAAISGAHKVEEQEDVWVVHPAVGMANAISLQLTNGESVQVLILSREQALQTYRFHLWGEEQLILSDAHLYVKNEQLICTSVGRSQCTVSIWSDGANVKTNAGALTEQQTGPFTAWVIECPAYQPTIEIAHPKARFAQIDIDPNWPSYIEDVFLKVDYDGDVATAHIGAHMMTDHIHYGAPWYIGLKENKHKLNQNKLSLAITPLRKGEIHSYVNQAYVERFEGVEIAQFNQIDAIPHYRVAITKLPKE
ncbi:beta-galactosidase [Radiobacillus sp. PE A8.2]|uniref:beta-galactosidase n=1 Tax=Radiobacillus sp. PE A8.2 TaxID=3380349 RepID=UPI00388E7BD7